MSKDNPVAATKKLSIPAPVHRLLPVAGAVLIVLGLLLLWLGWRQSADERLANELGTHRAAAVAVFNQRFATLTERFEQQRQQSEVVAALAADDEAAAAQAMLAGWDGALAAEFHAPDLGAIMAGDLARFGFGRLALIEKVLVEGGIHVAVIRDGGQPRVAVAGPIMDGNRFLAVGLVVRPVELMAEALAALTPGGLYLGIKQGRYLVAQAGDAELAGFAEANAVPLAGAAGLRIVAAAPQPGESAIGGGMGYGLGGLLVLAGLGCLVAFRRIKPAADEEDADTGESITLAEALRAQGPATAPRPRVAREKPRDESKPLALDRHIFRAYDIRGVVGETLDPGIARLIGQAIGTVMHERGLRDIVVGRDGRVSGPSLSEGLIAGLREAGCDVVDIGQAATPVVYFGAFHLRTGSCVAVTGSHNPPDYNGFKIVIGGETLSGKAIENLYTRIVDNALHAAQPEGALHRRELTDDYVQRISMDVQLERRLKVVVDCGNGVPGAVAPQVLESIGCEVVPLFCEVDGAFPNHHPDPSDPDNLGDLIRMVKRLDADIGVAFDGDGDRLGVVTREGEIIYPDRLLMLFAQDVLARNPGACVIYDVKCTGHLAGHILRHGGSPVMWKTGHSLIKAKMKETEAELAGEMSGHFFFRERWYGFDDGIYSAARLLEILAADPRSPEEVFAELPKGVSTPELKVPMAEGEHYAFIKAFAERASFDGARIVAIDGIRADWPDGWGLVRASNTTPVLVLRFDADSQQALDRIQAAFRAQLQAVKPDIQLPF